MADISQTTFSWKESFVFLFKFHWIEDHDLLILLFKIIQEIIKSLLSLLVYFIVIV